MVACFLLTSCASTRQVTTHLEDAQGVPAHDEQQGAGMTIEYFPNQSAPDRISTRFDAGGMLDAICDSQARPCTQWKFKATGFRQDHLPKGWLIALPEGTYTLTGTDDPNIAVLKDANTQQTVAYWVNNKNGHGTRIVGNLKDAEAAETAGDGWKTAGKVVGYTLLAVLVVGLVVVLAAGAFAEGYNQAAAQQQSVVVERPATGPTYTHCTPDMLGGFRCWSY